MPGWPKDREARKRDTRNYGPEYRKNREITRRRANGVCEGCRHRHAKLECDHINGVQAGHALSNLQMLCKGPGTCQCHEKKTATEGGGFRQRGRRRGNAADPPPRPRTVW